MLFVERGEWKSFHLLSSHNKQCCRICSNCLIRNHMWKLSWCRSKFLSILIIPSADDCFENDSFVQLAFWFNRIDFGTTFSHFLDHWIGRLILSWLLDGLCLLMWVVESISRILRTRCFALQWKIRVAVSSHEFSHRLRHRLDSFWIARPPYWHCCMIYGLSKLLSPLKSSSNRWKGNFQGNCINGFIKFSSWNQ